MLYTMLLIQTINTKAQELSDIVYEPNHELLRLLINESIKDENDGHKQHSHESFQSTIPNISFLFGYPVQGQANGEYEQPEKFSEKLPPS